MTMYDLTSRVRQQPPMLYQNAYVWLLFVSAMDIMMTWIILLEGGIEVNALADAIIRAYGLPGMVTYKFVLVTFFIVICEVVGRQKPVTGRRLAWTAVGLTCIPVTWAFVQLLTHAF